MPRAFEMGSVGQRQYRQIVPHEHRRRRWRLPRACRSPRWPRCWPRPRRTQDSREPLEEFISNPLQLDGQVKVVGLIWRQRKIVIAITSSVRPGKGTADFQALWFVCGAGNPLRGGVRCGWYVRRQAPGATRKTRRTSLRRGAPRLVEPSPKCRPPATALASSGFPDGRARHQYHFVTTHAPARRAVRRGPSGWRRGGYIRGWPWSGGSWRCGNRPRHIHGYGSSRRSSA
jgi:hypothetical protein